ncbi:hypothetical protein [Bacillus subtilis]|uniref:hypothetical protein n=1 Tax=Bacillus subtilis TaxID=1423 RepID=UPI0001F5BE94|nr:hypothetical protein [Bacillus subtilis]ADV95563.1 hypothetical protein BSn5_14775 [Bacillus subtilis BSn5]TDO84948.1 hypothetical protein BDW29_3876 [Bacillus sp. AtDRG31]MED4864538.1 hypothetical protein [Bacillus subtilis]WBY37206.1 hypothetical protein PF977_19230 [Bacillus subtilis]CAF1780521.1 hypothetical protein NRS6110_03707 [Bacillus subtilis]
MVRIKKGKQTLEVTERAFEVVYKAHGFKLDKGTSKKEAEDTQESDAKETAEE